MILTIYSRGKKEVTVPAGGKITVETGDKATVSQKIQAVGKPSFFSLLTQFSNGRWTSNAFAADTTLLIEANAGDVTYSLDGVPPIIVDGGVNCPAEASTPPAPSSGFVMYSDASNTPSFIDKDGNIATINAALNADVAAVKRNVRDVVLVNMAGADYTLSASEARAAAVVAYGAAPGGSTLYWPNNPDVPYRANVYNFGGIWEGQPITVALVGYSGSAVKVAGGFAKTIALSTTTMSVSDTLANYMIRPYAVPVTGATYTPKAIEVDCLFDCTNAVGCAFLVPSDTTLPLEIGSTLSPSKGGTGDVTITADTGVTIQKRLSASLTISEGFDKKTLVKVAANTWRLIA